MIRKTFAGALLLASLLTATFTQSVRAQQAVSPIRVNQWGYMPSGPHIAVAVDAPDTVFYIFPVDRKAPDSPRQLDKAVFKGHLGPLMRSHNSGLTTRVADFSQLHDPNLYQIYIPGLKPSPYFAIRENAANAIAQKTLKGFYFQRASMAIDRPYAGDWPRKAGHPDTKVFIHPSAASVGRPARTVISTPGGWYDAGDYNKYIVNSGITMGTLLSAYEDFPAWWDSLRTEIPPLPAPASTVPDILNEALYNLRWMLTMQDPADGGVYHKCTNAVFDKMVMPAVCNSPRYVVQKGTAATLDFAAVTAQASRVLKKFSIQFPGLADSCLKASRAAWQWAVSNPKVLYNQDSMNLVYSPKVSTGAYGDKDMRDEWFWAACELRATTGDPTGEYHKVITARFNDPAPLPTWSNVHMLGLYTLLRFPLDDHEYNESAHAIIVGLADTYDQDASTNAFHTVMGGSPKDFSWGSNSVAANQGILLITAWKITKDPKYIDLALSNLDYIMGRNATGYCFVTGMGALSPMHPHHRPSIGDGVEDPVPGLLAGGPNPGQQDHVHYDHTEPETAYMDVDESYASNEIAINWNAPIVYLAGAMDAIKAVVGYSHSATSGEKR